MISLKFIPKGLINNIPALVQVMAWRRFSDSLVELIYLNMYLVKMVQISTTAFVSWHWSNWTTQAFINGHYIRNLVGKCC